MGWFEYGVCGGGCNAETIHGSENEVRRWMQQAGWMGEPGGLHIRCPNCAECDCDSAILSNPHLAKDHDALVSQVFSEIGDCLYAEAETGAAR